MHGEMCSISMETRRRVQTLRTLQVEHCVPFRFNPRAIQQGVRSHPDRMWRYKWRVKGCLHVRKENVC